MTAPATPRDLVSIGPATIFVASIGATAPTIDDLAALVAGTFAGYTSVGNTAGPATLTETPKQVEVRREQFARPVGHFNNQFETMLMADLGDTTLANMALAYNAATSGSTLTGSDVGWAARKAVAVIMPFGAAGQALVNIPLASVRSPGKAEASASKDRTMAVEFVVESTGTGTDYTLTKTA